MAGRARRALLAATGGVAALAVAASLWVMWPLPAEMTREQVAPAVTIVDRHGLALRGTRAEDGTRARWVKLGDVDPELLTAFVAVEDRRFFEHRGVDWRAVARALRDDLRARRVVSGASTLTMQAARMMAGTDRDWLGKAGQALWALRLERHLTKQQILEQYLNRVHLGQGTVGVAAASALYFDASPRELSVAQAALLAGIAHAPASDNPIASPARARRARARALSRIGRAGFVARADAERAVAEPLMTRGGRTPFLAPHFTTRAIALAYDSGLVAARDGVVRTSLDLGLQSALEDEVRHTVDLLRGRGVREASLVVLDNPTGEVLAWIGSPDFWADTAGQTDMVVSPRQPGSALKPFVYGLAFDRGFTPATVLADVARSYQTAVGTYRPRNYDHRYHGPVRVREALGSSYNVPAVEMAERLGVASVLGALHAAGFASLRRPAEHYGLGIALGNGDVTLLELANGYRALANDGEWSAARWRPLPPGRDARDVERRRVVSPGSAALVLDILSDAEARVPAFGLATPFDFAFPVAAKTGTSRHFTDNWAVGVTGRFTVAVWVGNFSGRPMEGVSGVSGAGPLLHRAIVEVAKRYPPGTLATPDERGYVRADICRLSGLRATAECPRTSEWFAADRVPVDRCDWHGPNGLTLPSIYAEWLEQARSAGAQGAVVQGASTATTPRGGTVARGTAPRDSAQGFRIVSPLDGDRYSLPPSVERAYATIPLRATGARGTVRWFVDGRLVEIARLPLVRGAHRVVAEAGGERREVGIVVD